MKTLRLFFLISIPVILLSCNSNTSRNRDKDNDVNESGMLVKDKKVVDNNTRTTALDTRVNGSASAGNNDESFVKDAASGGMMEVELAKYAQQHAQSQRVKNFAAMIVKDHTSANAELKTIASTKNISLSSTMENSENKKVLDLQNEKGANFDRKYMSEMVDDHGKDVEKFKKQAQDGNDPELKAFATKILPVLIVHQDSAKIIKDALR